jgi:hypothetical protein
MFRREINDLVKGSMLALTIDAIMDFAGDRTGSFRMIQCEVQSHDAYGTPRELFGKFFGVIAETICEIGKYPPAEPGALGIGPLEAAVRVADATLHSLAT